MLSWPNAENPNFTLEVEIDERTIEQHPFETTHEIVMGAMAHNTTAANALALRNELQDSPYDYSVTAESIAFWHACQAKHCLAYASQSQSEPPPTFLTTDILNDADRIIGEALQHRADNIPDHFDIDPVAKALISARARLSTVLDLTEKLEDLHPQEDSTARRAVIRMIAYMGAIDNEADPAVVYNGHCQETIISLHAAANAVVQHNHHLLRLNVDDGMTPFQ